MDEVGRRRKSAAKAYSSTLAEKEEYASSLSFPSLLCFLLSCYSIVSCCVVQTVQTGSHFALTATASISSVCRHDKGTKEPAGSCCPVCQLFLSVVLRRSLVPPPWRPLLTRRSLARAVNLHRTFICAQSAPVCTSAGPSPPW